ncbi:hypothetical protein GA0115251_106933 [Streptomyces sp. TverLS-915]|uniref:hypothetical protein n=1 Tax=Streptomyces sp. TverLS-915 TaxID=1839763 RepID=UPI00081DB92E|nr:hypothetical protein [Streptomyces sp. TverLS-915]SCD41095.1 hypothetical protein GA0115251_106933 [Streptomyces sp. TverLS-915]
MSAHPRFFQQLSRELAAASSPARRDELLDYWIDCRDRATEWDAHCWGFNPDTWCASERAEMERRAKAKPPSG